MTMSDIPFERGTAMISFYSPCFVFVVCGEALHVRELHLALAAVRRNSKADILVVTDSARNEISVEWPDVIDVPAPPHLDHHQASIYLKTRLHRLLPPSRRYCYLDCDVFATGSDVDEIFSSATTPVAFATDMIRLHEFSLYAMRCDCMEANASERAEIEGILAVAYHSCVSPSRGWVASDYETNASRPLVRLKAFISHLLMPRSPSQITDLNNIVWRNCWHEFHSKVLYQPDSVIQFVESSSGWRRVRRRQSWISPTGKDVFHPHCDHLVEAVRETFGIKITRPRWQHWNGGVFLFDERGHGFLDAWHEKTMRIFCLPGWQTRDQGTLAATAWEFGLQDQTPLPQRFNCILDPHRGDTMVSQKGDALTTDAFLTKVRPALAHVLKRTGDPTWDVWRWVQSRALVGAQDQSL